MNATIAPQLTWIRRLLGLGLILWLSGALGLAQTRRINFEYNDGQTLHKGQVFLKFYLFDGKSRSTISSPGEVVTLDLVGVPKGKGKFTLEITRTTWPDEPDFDARLLVDRDDMGGIQAPGLSLSRQSSTSTRLEFAHTGPGEGTIRVPVRIRTGEGTSSASILTLEQGYRILVQEAPAPEEPAGPSNEELLMWEAAVNIVTSDNATPKKRQDAMATYLRKYPDGEFSELARNMIQEIEAEQEAAAPEPEPRPAPQVRNSTPQPSPEEVLWQEISSQYRRYGRGRAEAIIQLCRDYLNRYPNGDHVEEVAEIRDDLTPMNAEVVRDQNHFTVILRNGRAPLDYRIDQEVDSLVEWDPTAGVFDINLPDNRTYAVTFTDGRGERITRELSTEFEPLTVSGFRVINEGALTQAVGLTIKGGKAPYWVQFIPRNETVVVQEFAFGAPRGDTLLDIQALQATLPEEQRLAGPYYLRFTDDRKAESVHMDGMQNLVRLERKREDGIPNWAWIVLILVGMGLIVGFNVWQSRQRAAKQREMEARREKARQTARQTGTQSPVSAPINQTPNKPEVRSRGMSEGTTKMVIRQRSAEPADTPPENTEHLLGSHDENYFCFPLSKLWKDSAVAEVFIHRDCAKDLDVYIYKHNVDVYKKEKVDDIPEIGGFLLGTYRYFEDSGQYKVSLERFQPSTTDDQDLYRISFKEQAWNELADLQDLYPDLKLVGWFHTHPGHGLFLSQPDLRIHQGFFRNKHYLAIEIDTKTETLDTAIFTRTQDGTINNSKDRISPGWFHWTDLEDWIKEKQQS
ncbi:MAG: hypothetical protein D6722_05055 [Bacteroidetes bacterium]|nr:MAG: hypothetical protein D6722_05055 [Bacteroidota bacterium]